MTQTGMKESGQTPDIEASLLARAETLAREYRESALHRREEILGATAEHLKLREEHELLSAKEAADRQQRQRVQAAEIQLQGDLDRTRWTLVQSVLTQLDEAVAQLAQDETRYLHILERFIASGAAVIDAPTIIVALNARDRARVSNRWEAFTRNLAVGKTLQLAEDSLACSGGALLRDPDNRVRVDNTFEGRKKRLAEALAHKVMEQLFGAGSRG